MGKSKKATRAAGYDSDKELAKKRKNAEAQADFRKRRTQYVIELETTVEELQSTILQLRDLCSVATEETKAFQAIVFNLQGKSGSRQVESSSDRHCTTCDCNKSSATSSAVANTSTQEQHFASPEQSPTFSSPQLAHHTPQQALPMYNPMDDDFVALYGCQGSPNNVHATLSKGANHGPSWLMESLDTDAPTSEALLCEHPIHRPALAQGGFSFPTPQMIAPSAYPKQFGHSPVHQWSPLYMPRPSIDTHLLSSGDPYGQDDMPGLTRSTSYSPDSDSLVTPPSSMLGLPHQLFDHPQSYGRSSGMSDASTPRLFSPEPLLAADSGYYEYDRAIGKSSGVAHLRANSLPVKMAKCEAALRTAREALHGARQEHATLPTVAEEGPAKKRKRASLPNDSYPFHSRRSSVVY